MTDVHELKKAAITERFIPKDGSWIEKLEIRTETDRIALQEIQVRFTQPAIFYDDLSVPFETIVYNSKISAYLILFFSLTAAFFSIVFFAAINHIAIPAILIIAACLGLWRFRKLSQRYPQIVINNEGIQTNSTGLTKWSDIKAEEVEYYQAGKNSRYYLKFQTPKGNERISLEYLDISPRKLNHLLYVYRRRK